MDLFGFLCKNNKYFQNRALGKYLDEKISPIFGSSVGLPQQLQKKFFLVNKSFSLTAEVRSL